MPKKQGPKRQAEIGSVWELDVGDKGEFTALVVVVGELRRESGNYPCLILDNCGSKSMFPGKLINAAVTTARWWRRFA